MLRLVVVLRPVEAVPVPVLRELPVEPVLRVLDPVLDPRLTVEVVPFFSVLIRVFAEPELRTLLLTVVLLVPVLRDPVVVVLRPVVAVPVLRVPVVAVLRPVVVVPVAVLREPVVVVLRPAVAVPVLREPVVAVLRVAFVVPAPEV